MFKKARSSPGARLGVAAATCAAQLARIAQGHRLATQMCSECHFIESGGLNSWTDAPSIMSIANRGGMNHAQLTDFIMKSHFKMINWNLTRAQVSHIASYSLSLQHQ